MQPRDLGAASIARISLRETGEEVAHLDVKRRGQLPKHRGRHAGVGALVLLNLLEADAAPSSQILLSHAQEAAAAAHSLPHNHVDLIGHH